MQFDLGLRPFLNWEGNQFVINYRNNEQQKKMTGNRRFLIYHSIYIN